MIDCGRGGGAGRLSVAIASSRKLFSSCLCLTAFLVSVTRECIVVL